jgi:hypothetical protein
MPLSGDATPCTAFYQTMPRGFCSFLIYLIVVAMARSLRINHGLKSLRVQFCHCQTLQIAPIRLTEGKCPIFRSETSKWCRQVSAGSSKSRR